MNNYIHDTHTWIQSSKSSAGETLCVCLRCKHEVLASELLNNKKDCNWQWANKYSGFEDKTLKYWWVHLACGTFSHIEEW